MSLHGSSSHFELFGDFGVVTALQKQFDDFFSRGPSRTDCSIITIPAPLVKISFRSRYRAFPYLDCFHIW
jgi:hypothetical protein